MPPYSNYYYGPPGFGGRITPGVKGLLIANGAVFLLQYLAYREMVYLFGLTPAAVWSQKAFWQPVTYMFLHGGLLHLALNMFVLFLFGGSLEAVWGTKRFLRYYFLTGVGAGLSNCILTPHLGVSIIGASGAVYGLLAAYGVLFPESLVYIYFLFPIRAKYLVVIFGLFEFFASLWPGASPVAHLVHLGGMVIGLIYLKWGSLVRWGARTLKESQRQREYDRRAQAAGEEAQLRREVDDLLDKISEVGMDNLTPWERRRLKEASDLLRQMEGKAAAVVFLTPCTLHLKTLKPKTQNPKPYVRRSPILPHQQPDAGDIKRTDDARPGGDRVAG